MIRRETDKAVWVRLYEYIYRLRVPDLHERDAYVCLRSTTARSSAVAVILVAVDRTVYDVRYRYGSLIVYGLE